MGIKENCSFILNDKNLIAQVNKLIYRIQGLHDNHHSLRIKELQEIAEKVNLFYFISQNNTEYKWDEIKKDFNEANKYRNIKEHDPVKDIVRYKKFQNFVSREIKQQIKCIDKKNMNRARKSLCRKRNKKNIEMDDFLLYPGESDIEKIMLLFITYQIHVSGLSYHDSAHHVGQIILNEVLESVTGSKLLNVTHAISSNLEEYKSQIQEIDLIFCDLVFKEFVEYMLKILLQQVVHLEKMLRVENILDEIQKYILVHNEKTDAKKIPDYAILLLKELLLVEEIPRGQVKRLIGTKDRTATNLISQLLNHGLISSLTPKGNIRLGLGYLSPCFFIRSFCG